MTLFGPVTSVRMAHTLSGLDTSVRNGYEPIVTDNSLRRKPDPRLRGIGPQTEVRKGEEVGGGTVYVF